MKPNITSRNNLKFHRKYHRIFAIWFLFFFLILSGTGILLGWKKHSAGVILPRSMEGSSKNISEWLSFDSLTTIAIKVLHDSVSEDMDPGLNRIDARPGKGMVNLCSENILLKFSLMLLPEKYFLLANAGRM